MQKGSVMNSSFRQHDAHNCPLICVWLPQFKQRAGKSRFKPKSTQYLRRGRIILDTTGNFFYSLLNKYDFDLSLMIIKLVSIAILLIGLAKETPAAQIVGAMAPPNSSGNEQVLNKKDAEVIIYSSKRCHYCTSVKKEFDERKVPYTVKLVDNNPALMAELKKKPGKIQSLRS